PPPPRPPPPAPPPLALTIDSPHSYTPAAAPLLQPLAAPRRLRAHLQSAGRATSAPAATPPLEIAAARIATSPETTPAKPLSLAESLYPASAEQTPAAEPADCCDLAPLHPAVGARGCLQPPDWASRNSPEERRPRQLVCR